MENYQLEGELLPIFTYPAPVLKKIAEPVTLFNDELKLLIRNMLYTMYKAPGIGLAAPQVGVSHRIFVIDIDFEREEVTLADGSTDYRISNFNPRVFINPVFKNKKGEQICEEGCLSVPGVYVDVKRSLELDLEYLDVDGNKHSMNAQELLAVCIQHENDHLDGIVFFDRISLLKKQLLTKKYLKSKKRM